MIAKRCDMLTDVLRKFCGAIQKSLSVWHFVRCHRAAFYADRVCVLAGVGVTVGGKWGVSDPLRLPPIVVPSPSRKGSLTPHLRVVVVRSRLTQVMSSSRAAGCNEYHLLVLASVELAL
jgi:hypothetical protein